MDIPNSADHMDGRKAKGLKRRAEIRQTALVSFGKQGFRGSSLKEIADSVGISEAGLLHHFGSKVGLLGAVMEERDAVERDHRQLAEGDGTPFVDTMRDLVRRNAQSPGLVALHVVLSAEATESSHPAHDLIQNRYQALRHQDDSRFEELQQRGELRPDLNPQLIGQLVTAVMDGIQLQWLLDPDNVDMNELFEEFLTMLGVPPEGNSTV